MAMRHLAKSRKLAFTVALLLASSVRPTAAFDPLDIDGRINHAKKELTELQKQAENSGNRLIVTWANHMVDVLDHLDTELTKQQADFWRQADTQRERFFNDLSSQIEQIRSGTDLTLDRIENIDSEFEDTLATVLRASKEPYLTRYGPTFLVPTGKDIILHLHGKYLNGAKLIDSHGKVANRIVEKENAVDFDVSPDSLPTPTRQLCLFHSKSKFLWTGDFLTQSSFVIRFNDTRYLISFCRRIQPLPYRFTASA